MSKDNKNNEGTKGTEEIAWDGAFDLSYYTLSTMRLKITVYKICGIVSEETS